MIGLAIKEYSILASKAPGLFSQYVLEKRTNAHLQKFMKKCLEGKVPARERRKNLHTVVYLQKTL